MLFYIFGSKHMKCATFSNNKVMENEWLIVLLLREGRNSWIANTKNVLTVNITTTIYWLLPVLSALCS
jgi:hypothetical protein